jgi:simple sugar transport system substrate-binding protein
MKLFLNIILGSVIGILIISCGSTNEEESSTMDMSVDHGSSPFKFGMILVGPKNDKGWSQAHYEGGQYIEEKLGGKMIVADMINPADSPNLTVDQVISDMIGEGAQMIFATSDDMKDGVLAGAEKFPNIPIIWASGDSAKSDGKGFRSDLSNLGNIMGKMEYGKMIAGCAAALKSSNGHIGFLGPLINDETRRLANAAYLGASHCWQGDGDIKFEVVWIGFWFHIPGVTSDPTQVANEFFDSGADVIISHIDTPEGLVVTGQRASEGEDVYVVGYDYEDSCATAPEVCLGVPYFNWGPEYLNAAMDVVHGEFSSQFVWMSPNWDDMNDEDSSIIGYKIGEAMSASETTKLETFILELGSGKTELFQGPLNFQDGTSYLSDGVEATDNEIWYTPQLLEGMVGDSQ